MEPCLMPKLDYAPEAIRVKPEATTFLLYDRLSDRSSKLNALQKAIGPLRYQELLWALVLRIYTGNELVAFVTPSNGSCSWPHGQVQDICSTLLSPSQTVPSIKFRHKSVCSQVDKNSWNASLLPNTEVLYVLLKPYIHYCEKSGKERTISEPSPIKSSISPPAPARDEAFKARRIALRAVFSDCLGNLTLRIQSPTSEYSERAMINVGYTCRTVFQSLLENPHQTIGGLLTLSALDIDQISRWNGGVRPSVQATVHGEISRHVETRPDAPALHSWDGDFTYVQLDLASGNVASHLRGLGMCTGDLVPVFFEKSKWAAVAMLGILKGGITYRYLTLRLMLICGKGAPLCHWTRPIRLKESRK
ncbi:MAG: hypothetical protein Q9220_002185 [cf. Caloplaca sp. 1 TL-2023]